MAVPLQSRRRWTCCSAPCCPPVPTCGTLHSGCVPMPLQGCLAPCPPTSSLSPALWAALMGGAAHVHQCVLEAKSKVAEGGLGSFWELEQRSSHITGFFLCLCIRRKSKMNVNQQIIINLLECSLCLTSKGRCENLGGVYAWARSYYSGWHFHVSKLYPLGPPFCLPKRN